MIFMPGKQLSGSSIQVVDFSFPTLPFKAQSPHKAGSCLSIRQNMACATFVHPPGREDMGVSMPVRVPVARGPGSPGE